MQAMLQRTAMVVVVTARLRQALVLAVAVLVGCAGDARARLSLAEPEGSALLATAATIELAVSRDNHRVAFVSEAYTSGAALDVGDIVLAHGITISATARDGSGVALAYGVLGPGVTDGIASAHGTCCLTMCMCAPSVQDSGACTCGSSRCQATCD
jgi:hypothetical protein